MDGPCINSYLESLAKNNHEQVVGQRVREQISLQFSKNFTYYSLSHSLDPQPNEIHAIPSSFLVDEEARGRLPQSPA